MLKRLLFICALPSVIVGCAGSRPPAPVYESHHSVVSRNAPPVPAEPEQPRSDQGVGQTIEIKPLQESAIVAPVELPAEPLLSEQAQSLLTPEQEKELALLEQSQHTIPPVVPQDAVPESTAPSAPVESAQASPIPLPEPPPPPPEPTFEPLTSFVPLSPAVGALVVAANQSDQKGNVQSATTTIERAIRIEPRNATLYYKLALLRLKESRPRLAEDLAKKSALLASNDTRLKKHSWLLIARAREMQKNFDGAKEAKAKADAF